MRPLEAKSNSPSNATPHSCGTSNSTIILIVFRTLSILFESINLSISEVRGLPIVSELIV